MPFHPAGDSFKETVAGLRIDISVQVKPGQRRKGFLHIGGGPEIHIGYPQRKHIRRIAPPLREIIFQAAGISPVDYFIKIQVLFSHFIYLFAAENDQSAL